MRLSVVFAHEHKGAIFAMPEGVLEIRLGTEVSKRDSVTLLEAKQEAERLGAELVISPPLVLTFKDEDDAEGESCGPWACVPEFVLTDFKILGRPYRAPCLCEIPDGLPETPCRRCGDEVRVPWVLLREVEAMADRLGLPLVAE